MFTYPSPNIVRVFGFVTLILTALHSVIGLISIPEMNKFRNKMKTDTVSTEISCHQLIFLVDWRVYIVNSDWR